MAVNDKNIRIGVAALPDEQRTGKGIVLVKIAVQIILGIAFGGLHHRIIDRGIPDAQPSGKIAVFLRQERHTAVPGLPSAIFRRNRLPVPAGGRVAAGFILKRFRRDVFDACFFFEPRKALRFI